MEWLISVSFGEIFLKGKNRNLFFENAIDNIKRNIEKIGYDDMYVESAKLYIKADFNKFDHLIEEIKKVFGIVYVSKVLKCEKNIEDFLKASSLIIDQKYTDSKYTFKVLTTRVDKSFNYNSPELNSKMGELILDKYENLSVDIHNPDFVIFIDIKNNAYVYSDRQRGFGGLPVGSSGEGLLLLSGGIDSPVAGFMMAKRGMKINALHFHSYPFTSKRAYQKAMDLAQILSLYSGKMTVFSVNLAEIYKAISRNCDRRETTVLSRRFMMRIAEKISNKYNYEALITGESLGQVASQTLESISVIDRSVEIPILRPLIAMDKQDIIDVSKRMGAYEKSIEPYDDCCSIFAPDKPVTKPRLNRIINSEEKLDIENLEQQALENIEIISI